MDLCDNPVGHFTGLAKRTAFCGFKAALEKPGFSMFQGTEKREKVTLKILPITRCRYFFS
jgi:hypothetical protein